MENCENILSFPTPEDYKKCINYLAENPQNSVILKNELSFVALNDVKDAYFIQNYCGDIFSSILSADLKIIINDVLFAYDFDQETVKCTFFDQVKSSNNIETIYSFDDDLFETLFGEGENNLKADELPCGSRDTKNMEFYSDWAGKIYISMHYIKLAIYFELNAIISKDYIGHADISVGYYTNACYRNSTERVSIYGPSQTTSGLSAKIMPYSDSKKLYGFYFKASFMADVADLDSGDDPSTQYQINCNCDDCSWY